MGHTLEEMFLSAKNCKNIVLKVKIQNGLSIGKNSIDQMCLFKLFYFHKTKKHHGQHTVCNQSYSTPILSQSSLSEA